MTNQVTRGKAYAGRLRGRLGGLGVFVKVGSIPRANSGVAQTLFTIPQDAQILSLVIIGTAVSNAGTSATISVGKSGGTGAEYLSAFDVKGATGAGQQTPTAAIASAMAPAAASADTTVTGTYTESGTASTSGGPWTVVMEYAS